MGLKEWIFGKPPEEKIEDKCKAKETFNEIQIKVIEALVQYHGYMWNLPSPMVAPKTFESDQTYQEYCIAKIVYDKQMSKVREMRECAKNKLGEVFGIIPVADTWFKILIKGNYYGVRKSYIAWAPSVFSKKGIYIVDWNHLINYNIGDFAFYSEGTHYHDLQYMDDRIMAKLCAEVF